MTRCFAFNAVDLTFSFRSLVTTLVVVLVAVLVLFLALAVAAAVVVAAAAAVVAGVSFFLAEAAASLVSFFGAIDKGNLEKVFH